LALVENRALIGDCLKESAMAMSKSYMPAGFHSVTPYLVCPGVAKVIEFATRAFGAVEVVRVGREDGSIAHACVKVGDSMVEMGEAQGEWRPMTAGLHLYVPDVEAVYARAIAAGGKPLYPVKDMEYGDREGGVADPSGNDWYIGTHKAGKAGQYAPDGLRSVTAGFRVAGLAEFVGFLRKGFAADVVSETKDKSGAVFHAVVRIGDTLLECGEAHGEWGPRPVAIHIYVPDADSAWRAAIAGGATLLSEPKDQFYGERSGGVIDGWGNHWYIATHQEDLTAEELASRGAGQGESVK
jgi:PhnB protein